MECSDCKNTNMQLVVYRGTKTVYAWVWVKPVVTILVILGVLLGS